MHYNVAIIGGGPAGLMAAGRAGQLGATVILLEKNSQLGIKLLMTGGGRCPVLGAALRRQSKKEKNRLTDGKSSAAYAQRAKNISARPP